MNNYAFIDAQNLILGTRLSQQPWDIDLFKFRIYLKEKYKVDTAYYYIGYKQNKHKKLYKLIDNSGFQLVFRKHNSKMIGKKKGNVDGDIIFDIMYKLYKKKVPNRIILISGDGDYKSLVDFLIEEGKFEKILFPNERYASSLYKNISRRYFDNLDKQYLKGKLSLNKK